MNDMGDGSTAPQPPSQQGRYYDRYLDSGPQNAGGGNGPGDQKRVALIAGGIAAVVLLAGGGIFLATRGDSSNTAQSSTSSGGETTSETSNTSTSSSSSSESSTSTSSSSSADPAALLAQQYGPPTKPGWKIVEGRRDTARAAYDVPGDGKWTVKAQDHGWGFKAEGSGEKNMVATAVSLYDIGFCDKNRDRNSAFVGFVNIGTREPSEAAPAVAARAAKLISYKPSTKTYGDQGSDSTKQVSINGGKTQAVQSTRVVQDGNPGVCDAAKVEVRTVAFTTNGISALFLVSRSVGSSSVLSDTDLDAIIASLRPLK